METNKYKFEGTQGQWHAVEYAGFIDIQDDFHYGSTNILNADYVGEDNMRANGNLIAAAPELLQALIKIVEMNRQHALDQYGDANKAESWACVTVARNAIHKALNINTQKQSV